MMHPDNRSAVGGFANAKLGYMQRLHQCMQSLRMLLCCFLRAGGDSISPSASTQGAGGDQWYLIATVRGSTS